MNSVAHNVHPINDTQPLWDFSDFNRLPETAESFVCHIDMITGNDHDTLNGIALLLKGIQCQKNPLNIHDFCDTVLREVFRRTRAFDEAQQEWEEKIVRGDK